MGENKKMESGFRIQDLILLESTFSRIDNVDFETQDAPKFNIDTHVSVDGAIINVIEEVLLVQKSGGIDQFVFKVRMAGVFEQIGESEIKDKELFGSINGAAIIYPYIREHITSVALKAGLGPLILPPVNFAAQNYKE